MRENGRSMVEMLGVLAIIGVLSIGAIAGYSKAMMRYRLNKQSEQLSTLINAVIRYQRNLRIPVTETSEGNAESVISYLRKLNEIPVEMLYSQNDKNYDRYIKDIFNNNIRISHHKANYMGLSIEIQNDNISKQTCQNVYLLAKNFSGDLGYVEILRSANANETQMLSHVYGDRFCSDDKLCFKNLKVTDTETLCNVCTESSMHCSLLFVWYDKDF